MIARSLRAVAAAALLAGLAPTVALAQQSGPLLTVPAPRAVSGPVLVEGAGVSLDRAGVDRMLIGASPEFRRALADAPDELGQRVALELVSQALLREAIANRAHERPEVRARAEAAAQNAIVEAYLDQITQPQLANFPSDAELRKVYQDNLKQLVKPQELQLAQFAIPAPPASDAAGRAAARKRADDARARAAANNGASFADVALENQGQQLGWIAVPNLQQEVRAAVENAQQGAVTPVIELPNGFVVLRVAGRRGGQTMTFEEAAPLLRPRLREQRLEQLRAQALAERLQKQQLNVRDEAALTAAVRGQ